MSVLGRFNNRPHHPLGWDASRSTDRFAYRIYNVRAENRSLRRTLLLGAIVGMSLLMFMIYARVSPSFQLQEAGTLAEASLANPTAAPIPIPPVILPVEVNESWGVVDAHEARVFGEPESLTAPVTTKLTRLTLIAIDKKTSNGWFEIMGVGWIDGKLIRTYKDEQAARDAINQGKNQLSNYSNLTTPR